jgi:hypothetical protein
VGVIVGREIFDRNGTKRYDLKGINIYGLSGELVGHLNDASDTDKRLDKATDRLFTQSPPGAHCGYTRASTRSPRFRFLQKLEAQKNDRKDRSRIKDPKQSIAELFHPDRPK